MSLAVDANLLLYASDRESSFHERARPALERLVGGSDIIYLFWPVIMAYVWVATHPSIFEHPMPPERARNNIETLLARPNVVAPGELDAFWDRFRDVASEADARGNLVTDAHIVALMIQHGVRTIWSNDRDFRRFAGIEVHDPFAGA